MDKIIFKINNHEDVIIKKDNDNYVFKDKEFSKEDISLFSSKLIKICRTREKMNVKSNNKIEIYDNNQVIVLTGIDNQVISFINRFLK